jgi:hypothetical protein
MTHPSSAFETSPGGPIAFAAAATLAAVGSGEGEIVEIIVLVAHDTPTNYVAIASRPATDFPPAEPLHDEAT